MAIWRIIQINMIKTHCIIVCTYKIQCKHTLIDIHTYMQRCLISFSYVIRLTSMEHKKCKCNLRAHDHEMTKRSASILWASWMNEDAQKNHHFKKLIQAAWPNYCWSPILLVNSSSSSRSSSTNKWYLCYFDFPLMTVTKTKTPLNESFSDSMEKAKHTSHTQTHIHHQFIHPTVQCTYWIFAARY